MRVMYGSFQPGLNSDMKWIHYAYPRPFKNVKPKNKKEANHFLTLSPTAVSSKSNEFDSPICHHFSISWKKPWFKFWKPLWIADAMQTIPVGSIWRLKCYRKRNGGLKISMHIMYQGDPFPEITLLTMGYIFSILQISVGWYVGFRSRIMKSVGEEYTFTLSSILKALFFSYSDYSRK